MDSLLRFVGENSTLVFIVALTAVYFALQLWILPALGVPT
jgi:hypothetical protein